MDGSIEFAPAVGGHCLTTARWVPKPIGEVFAFFADAHNLQRITPPWVGFSILTPAPIAMRTGALIDYRIRLWGLPVRWRTEISVWEPGVRFVDRQLRGPYTKWVHEHRFEAREGGTVCSDRVDYAHRGGPVGERVFVRPQLRRIFAYRWAAMDRILCGEGRDMFGSGAAIDAA
jgi:ligand-binding SRPBCC domain-containing protein